MIGETPVRRMDTTEALSLCENFQGVRGVNLYIPFQRKVFFVIIILVLSVSILEGTSRLILPSAQSESVVPPFIFQFNATLGWSLKPFSHGFSARTGSKIEYRINSKGLRDKETSYGKPKNTFRIVLLGNSRTFGYGIPIDKHFSTLLEGCFKRVEVINMGVVGFGIDQELLYLRSEGFRYEPDLVIAYVAHYGHHRHMHTQCFGMKKPRFLLVKGELLLTNSPVEGGSPVFGIHRQVHDWLARHSHVYRILSAGLVDLIQKAVNRKKKDKEEFEDGMFRKELYRLGEAIVCSMHKESRKHGASFVLVTQIAELHEAVLKRKIPALDVSQALSNRKFDLPDGLEHLSEAGNGVLAREIAKFLKENQWIPLKHQQAK